MTAEHCCLCGDATGKAGRADDSIFIDAGKAELGPLCEECRDGLAGQLEADMACRWEDWMTDLSADFKGVTDNEDEPMRLHTWEWLSQFRPWPTMEDAKVE